MKVKKRSTKRQQDKLENEAKTVSDYDWEALFKEGKLKTLTVRELNLYIKDKQIQCDVSARKMDKITVIAADIGKRLAYLINRKEDSDSSSDEESETEIVETQIASDSASSSEEEEPVKIQAARSSKFGQKLQGNWQSRQFFGD